MSSLTHDIEHKHFRETVAKFVAMRSWIFADRGEPDLPAGSVDAAADESSAEREVEAVH